MTIELRPASLDDCRFVWETNNHPTVRAVSLSSDEIAWDDHVRWYIQVLEDPNRHLMVACFEDADAGVIRFDVEERDCVVSVALSPAFRGRGLGRTLIETGTKHALHHWCDVVSAWIRPDNVASQRAFEYAGYQLVGEQTTANVTMLRLEAR